jgi:ribulose-5-phosphate 4-epimerase/fuculose-1-phosphate aldolase
VIDRIPDGVIDLAHRVARAGLVVVAGGNIAARISDDRMWVTPSGWSLADLRVADLVQVTLDGHHVDGVNAPTSELLLHLAALRARPDVVWSVHLHPPMATLLHGLDIPIRTITTDHAFYLRTIETVPYLHPGSAQLAHAAAAKLAAGADVVLLRYHGCLVVGDTPDLVLSRAINLEAAAEATYRARMLGDDATACPPEFLGHVRNEEARGHRYGLRGATP